MRLLTTASVLVALTSPALAGPVELTEEQMDGVTAGNFNSVIVFTPQGLIGNLNVHEGRADTVTLVFSGGGAGGLTIVLTPNDTERVAVHQGGGTDHITIVEPR